MLQGVRAEPSDGSSCNIDASLEMSITEELEGLTPDDWARLADAILSKDAARVHYCERLRAFNRAGFDQLTVKLKAIMKRNNARKGRKLKVTREIGLY